MTQSVPPAEVSTSGRAGRSVAHAREVWLGGAVRYAGNAFRGPIDDSGGSFDADLQADDTIVLVKTANNGGTFTLDGSVAAKGRVVTVVDADGNAGSNTVTIDSDGSSSINGDSNISTNNLARTWVYDGTDWYEIHES